MSGGMQVWATLLALEEDGEMVVGVVSAPAMGRRWWAARGAGAFTADVAGERAAAAPGLRDPRARRRPDVLRRL